ncbi:MAG TPA: hypothetical protein VJ570_12875 [Holophagaceae bacterium]|nr:hypothetical protein [Holophagaceae bacterium]
MSTMAQFRLLVSLLTYSSVVPLAAWAVNRWTDRYRREPWMGLLGGLYLFDCWTTAVMSILSFLGKPNNWFMTLNTPVGLVFAMMLLQGWTPHPRTRWIYRALLALGLIAAASSALILGISQRNTAYIVLQDLLVTVPCLVELNRLLRSDQPEPLDGTPLFWVLAAWATFHVSSLLFHCLASFFLRALHPPLLYIPWVVYGCIILISNLLAARAFRCPNPRSS